MAVTILPWEREGGKRCGVFDMRVLRTYKGLDKVPLDEAIGALLLGGRRGLRIEYRNKSSSPRACGSTSGRTRDEEKEL